MKALITGITGFAGGFLAEHLLALGDHVLGCSRRGEWPDWAGQDLRTQVRVLTWDVGKTEVDAQVQANLAKFSPDCIYHLAALSVPSDCGTNDPSERAIDVNVRGTERVLDLAASLPRRPRVVFTSTSHVYAKSSTRLPFDESAPTGPQRAYGKTKLMAEEVVRDRAASLGLGTIIVREFQHPGPRQEPRLMLPEWAIQVARPSKEPIRVKHLNTWIDLTDVRDVVRAYRLLAERGEPGSVYNVGSGAPVRTGDILSTLLKLGGSPRHVVELQPGPEKFDPIADTGRLQTATGWRPEIKLEATVRDTLAFWTPR
jgi:GDP-4-dehydro-6-deoxy-D-mannose reductase